MIYTPCWGINTGDFQALPAMKTPFFSKTGISVGFQGLVLVAVLLVAMYWLVPGLANISSQLPEETNPTESTVDNTEALFILNAQDNDQMLAITGEVAEAGGKLVHMYPNRVSIGNVSPGSVEAIKDMPGVDSVFLEPVNPEDFAYLSEDELLGVLAWNANFDNPPVDMSVGESLTGDNLKPAPNLQGGVPATATEQIASQQIAGSGLDGPPPGATFYDTSEYMAGSVSVSVILPESNGAIDPSTENWTANEEARVASEVQAGLNWWAARESLADLRFTYHFYYGRTNSRARTSYEPISRSADPYGNTGENLWVSQIMTKFGYTDSLRLDKVRHFNNDVRRSDNSNWAITYFVVDSSNDANGMFNDGYFAYMWVGGPYSVMTYDNDGYGINNMDAVAAHELGHGFYADDQYSPCSCNDYSGYLNYPNYNCENSCPLNVTSIMRGQVYPYSVGAVDRYARGQVGIIDANNNNILDVLEAKPSLSLNTSSGEIGTTEPLITGTAHVNAVENKNSSGSGTDLTISSIERVEYRVDGGGWVKASAPDGRFDEAEEDFEFMPTLSKGGHNIEVQTKDSADNWSDISSITLVVGEGRVITMSGYTGGPQVREFTQEGVVKPESFFAFPSFLRCGGRLAMGDIDKDGEDEIIVGSGLTARPHVVVYEKNGYKRGIDYRPYDINFFGGVDVAAADIDNDGKDEIVTSQFTDGNLVKVYKYNDERELLAAWRPFGSFDGGVTVSAGDVDGDGADEVICGASVGGGPHIRVYDVTAGAATLKPISFFAFHPNSRSGVDVAGGDVDGDGKAEIAVTQLFYEEAWTKVYRYNDAQEIMGEWRAFPAGVRSGGNVEMFDISNNGRDQVLVGPNMGGGPQVLGFEYDGELLLNFFAYATTFRGGVVPAGGFF